MNKAKPKFLSIHTLTGYSSVLLNRDDTGMAKRIPYGDSVRTRTSSQFNKRKMRTAEGEHSLFTVGDISVRSRETFKRLIAQPLIEAGHNAKSVVDVTVALMDAVFPPSDGAKKERKKLISDVEAGKADYISMLDRKEINVLSKSEIDYIKSLAEGFLSNGEQALKSAEEALKGNDLLKNLKNLGESRRSLDIAMFGRMVTGDTLSRADAAVHVAHGITVHAQQTETDFFTAVDDLVTGDSDNGGGHLGEVEVNSPLLYNFFVVDWNLLLSNLAGIENAAEVAQSLVENLIYLVTTSIVGAKKGGTAPYSSSDFIFVEVGSDQPRTLAEAFRTPARSNLESATSNLANYLAKKDAMHGYTNRRFVASVADLTSDVFGEKMSVANVAQAIKPLLEG